MSDDELIEIACVVRDERPDAIAVADGTTLTPAGGREFEHWFWLPKSQVEVRADEGVVAMPEWLAQAKGLI